MSVNLDGALVCTRAVYRKMAKRGGGAIVNQSSTAAWLYSNFYGLAKVGINGLTQQLATELGGQNIRVNAIAPGPIDTEANRTTTPQEMVADIVKGIPLSRMGDTGGSGRHVPVPAVGSGKVDHRPDLQCRRRPDHPVMRRHDDDDVKLGYIGLGNMGAPMAKRLVDWPGGLMVFDVRAEAMTPLAEAGATLADSVADVAAADIISVTVLNDEQVREVVGELGGERQARHGDRDPFDDQPDTAVELAEELRAAGHSHRRRAGQRWRRRGREG